MESKKAFANLLTTALYRIHDAKGTNLGKLEEDLGAASNTNQAIVQVWRKIKHKQLPLIQQVELAAKYLLEHGGLLDRNEFEQFLTCAGHPYPREAWLRLFPPLDLPASADHFIGRTSDVNNLLKALQPGQTVSLIGPGGVGKSALVAQVLHTLIPHGLPPDRFPDGVFFHDFYKQSSSDQALEQIYRAFARDEPPQPSPRDAARRALANKQTLLVLDGAEEADDLDKVLGVRDRNKCGVLIVTRFKQVARGTPLYLDVPSPPEANEVLHIWSTAKEGSSIFQVWEERQEDRDSTAYAICELLGYLPLALRLAGRYMLYGEIDARQFLAQLRETPLLGLHEEARQHHSVPTLLEKSIAKVSEVNPAAPQVLAVIGQLSYVSFALDTLATTLQMTTDQMGPILADMIRFSLLRRVVKEERYQVVHRLIHSYARERLTVSDAELARLADFYIQLTTRLNHLNSSDLTRLDAERLHVLAVLGMCAKREKWQPVISLVTSIDGYLDLQGHLAERTEANLYGISAADALQDYFSSNLFGTNLANVYCMFGQLDGAIEIYQKSLRNIRGLLSAIDARLSALDSDQIQLRQARTHFRRLEATVLNRLGSTYSNLGQQPRAGDTLNQGYAAAVELGDRSLMASIMSNMGDVSREMGKQDMAMKLYQSSLSLASEIGDQHEQSHLLGKIGIMHLQASQLTLASEMLQRARELAQQTGRRRFEGIYLMNLGLVCLRSGTVDQAISYFEAALKIAGDVGDTVTMGNLLNNLGASHERLEQYEKAIAYHRQRLRLVRSIEDSHSECHCLLALGRVHVSANQINEAIECYQQVLSIASRIGSQVSSQTAIAEAMTSEQTERRLLTPHAPRVMYPQIVLESLECLADCYLGLGQHENAIEIFRRILADFPNNHLAYYRITTSYLALGWLEEAKRTYQQRIQVQPEDGWTFDAYIHLSIIERHQGNDEMAYAYCERARMLARSLNLEHDTAPRLLLLEHAIFVNFIAGRHMEAIEVLQELLANFPPDYRFQPVRYALLASAPNPPVGVTEALALIERRGSV